MKAPGADCANCPAASGRFLAPQRPINGNSPRLVIVGEAPCSSDFENGGVFRSSGGRVIDRSLAGIGLHRRDCHLTNAVLCDCRLKDRKVAAQACRGRLALELAETGSAPVVTLDSIATAAVFPPKASKAKPKPAPKKPRKTLAKPAKVKPLKLAKLDIRKYRGSISLVDLAQSPLAGQPSPKERDTAAHGPATGVRTVLPLLHPAEVRKAPKWQPVWDTDFARIGRVIESGWIAPEDAPGRELVIPETLRHAREALAALAPGAPVSFDVETVGLGPTETALVCYGLSDGRLTVVIPWSMASNGLESFWPDSGRSIARATSQVLASRVCVTHNGPAFDHIVAQRAGITIGAWDDTILMAHALAGHMPKNLPFVVTALAGLDVGPWKMWESRTSSIEELWRYNGRDCLHTILAYYKLHATLHA